MPQPVRFLTDDTGQVWLVLDNGHRIRVPGVGGNGGETTPPEEHEHEQYVKDTGDEMSGGLSFGSQAVAIPEDVTRHLALYGTSYGFSVSSATLNHVAAYSASAKHSFRRGATEDAQINQYGLLLANGRSVGFSGTANGQTRERFLVVGPTSGTSPGLQTWMPQSGSEPEGLAPLSVMDPQLPEHAATKQWVESLFLDSAAIPSYGLGWAMYGGSYYQPYCYRLGAAVVMSGLVKRTATLTLTNTPVKVCDLPAGFITVKSQIFTTAYMSGQAAIRMNVEAGGTVTIQTSGPSIAMADGGFMPIGCVYLL